MHHLILHPGNLSEDIVTLTSTTIDPEGDDITYLWESNLDGFCPTKVRGKATSQEVVT